MLVSAGVMLVALGLALTLLLTIGLLAMFAQIMTSASVQTRVFVYLYFGAVTAVAALPLHGFATWWAMATMFPLLIEAVCALEAGYAFRYRDAPSPEAVMSKPQCSSGRFSDWQQAWEYVGLHHPELKTCGAEPVKKLAMLMYFGWRLDAVIESESGFSIHLERGQKARILTFSSLEVTGLSQQTLATPPPDLTRTQSGLRKARGCHRLP